jgi:hypothetical protein
LNGTPYAQKDTTQLQKITRIQAQKTQSKTQQKLCKKNLHNAKNL